MDTIRLTNLEHNLYVNNLNIVPPGSIMCFAGINAPQGWLLCTGQAVSRTDYAGLFNTIGTTYGSGNGTTTFNLPDIQDRFPMGKSNSKTLGTKDGANSVTLTSDKLPAHSHTASSASAGDHSHSGSTSTNGNHSHSINDPGHTHTQTTINDDYNNSGTNPPGFSADSAGSKTWSNISTAYTGISINSSGDHSHTLTTNTTGAHSHTITVDSTGSANPSIDVTNKHIILNYIIRY